MCVIFQIKAEQSSDDSDVIIEDEIIQPVKQGLLKCHYLHLFLLTVIIYIYFYLLLSLSTKLFSLSNEVFLILKFLRSHPTYLSFF
jgi:hypothetical protein